MILVDLFQFTNSYTVLADVAEIAHATEEDEEDQGADLRSECENYVFSSTSRSYLSLYLSLVTLTDFTLNL